MPKTDAEWRALDARIARMLGFKQQESPIDGTLLWIVSDEEEYLVEPLTHYAWAEWDVWQPHNDLAQVMQALEGLSQKDVNYSIARFAGREVIVQLWGYIDGAFVVRRRTGEILRQTICLAIEVWLDASR